mgnify:CR=1 FL=1
MILQLLTGIHNLTTLLFGIFISAFFLGVKPIMKNFGKLLLFALVDVFFYWNINLFTGTAFANQLYPVLVHFPLILFLFLCYRYSLLSCCISVFSAYLCCQFSNWIGLFALTLTKNPVWYYSTRIAITFITFFFLFKFVRRTTQTIFSKENKELVIIGFLPFIYYIFDYATTKFSHLLYSGNKAVVEFMSFAFCIAYLIFLLVYYKEFEKKQEIRQYSDLMEIQLLSIQKEIDQVRNSKQELSILRHDMRHHLNILMTLLQEDSTEPARKYIKEIGDAYDETIIERYSRNEMINSVISIYQMRFSDKGFALHCTICTGETLSCPDLAICTILSNALENAMHSLEKLQSDDKWARLSLTQKDHQLLLEIENPVDKVPKFIDGIPASSEKGHGIGVKSIVYYVEQLHGQYHFSVLNHTFILRIII